MVDQCSNPTAIQEGDLLAYLSGFASANVINHISDCLACQKEVVELKIAQAILDEVFYQSHCPDREELVAYKVGFLPHSENRIIKQHLSNCSSCTEFVAQLKRIHEQPDPLLTRIIQTAKRILAAIFQPTAPKPALALLGDEQERYIYQAEQYQIILTTSIPLQGSNLWEIEGHIVNHEDPQMWYEGHVTVLQNGQHVTSDEIDEFGFFALENLSPGHYFLHIELSNSIIPIEHVMLKLGT